MATGGVQSTADVSVNLENCASITEIHQALNNGGGGRSVWGYAQVGRNTSNNFKNTVGDPNTGSTSAMANVYIETRQNNNAFIHCLVTGNNGIKEKYLFSSLDYPSNNTQTQWLKISTGVTGVKGNAESTYRTGQVNLTPDDLGAMQREIAQDTISDLNNNKLTGHATLTNNPSYVGRGYATNLPPGMTTGHKWYSVYLLGSIQMAVGYTESGALWVRAYENSTWGSWHLVGGCTNTGQAIASSAATIDYQEIRRNGNVVTLCMRLHLTADVAGTGGVLCTLPDGFRPTSSIRIHFMTNSINSETSYHYSAAIGTNGYITTNFGSIALQSGKYVIIDTTFII